MTFSNFTTFEKATLIWIPHLDVNKPVKLIGAAPAQPAPRVWITWLDWFWSSQPEQELPDQRKKTPKSCWTRVVNKPNKMVFLLWCHFLCRIPTPEHTRLSVMSRLRRYSNYRYLALSVSEHTIGVTCVQRHKWRKRDNGWKKKFVGKTYSL